MGQYHRTVNLDKHEWLDPHQLGDGLNLCQQVSGSGGIASALFILCTASNGHGGGDFEEQPAGEERVIGRWAGDRIAVVGDYAKDSDLPLEFKASTIYGSCLALGEKPDPQFPDPTYRNISGLVIPVLQRLCQVVIEEGDGWRDRHDAYGPGDTFCIYLPAEAVAPVINREAKTQPYGGRAGVYLYDTRHVWAEPTARKLLNAQALALLAGMGRN